MKQVGRKKAGGAWICALEITHWLLTHHPKHLVLTGKVPSRAGEPGGSTRRDWLSGGGEPCGDELL